MITVATAHAASSAPPSAYFGRWMDHESWCEWDPATEWVRLESAPAVGVRGRLKPAGGPAVRFIISRCDPDRGYADTSLLLGARLVFDHDVQLVDGVSRLAVAITLTGPLAALWNRILGPGFRANAQSDLDRLVALVEGERAENEVTA